MVDVLAFDYVTPVCTGPRPFKVTNIVGTAFSIGGGVFMTAGHVMDAASGAPWAAMATVQSGGAPQVWGMEEVTVVRSHDVAFFRSAALGVRAFSWMRGELPMGADVRSIGYPYGLDLENNVIGIRAFTGHVVAAALSYQLPAHPPVYELSFRNPRGLSGAPVLQSGVGAIVGVVLGNTSTEMEVLRNREQHVEDGGNRIREEVYIRVEALELGVAIQAQALLDLRPESLRGESLAEHLGSQKLLMGSSKKTPDVTPPSDDR